MPKINRKKINQRYTEMNDAWQQKAPTVNFMTVSQTDLTDKKTAVADKETERDDLLARLRVVEDELDDLYTVLDETMVKVRNGVIGDAAFGDDSPLYGAMGFVRKSERKSGLTKKKKS